MARRSAYLREIDPVPGETERHMMALGFTRSKDYLDWCAEYDFKPWLVKARADFQDEAEAHADQMRARRKNLRLHKKPKAFLAAICAGDLTAKEIDRPNFRHVAEEIARTRASDRDSLCEMLIALLRYPDLVFGTVPGEDDVPFVRGLIRMHERRGEWVRPLAGWKAVSKNTRRQFSELSHHLFDRHGDVPRFMEAAWLRLDRTSRRYRDWFVHLGAGRNLRTAKVPVEVTRRTAHEFMRAPDDYTIEQAVRWGQLRALGAGRQVINAVAATRLGRSFDHEEFWVTVLQFFARQPMLDPRQVGPIVDYLHAQRFEPCDVEVAPGRFMRGPPAQPGLSMRGRTVETLLAQVAAWHRELGQVRRTGDGLYSEAGFEGYALSQHDGKTKLHWTIRQLRSARDLVVESRELSHCVSSYHWSCGRGHCTIWSLARSEGGAGYERRQTIEVNRTGTIVQCRGLANRDPSAEEWAVVCRWAAAEGLKIAAYL